MLRPFSIRDFGLWQSVRGHAVFLNSQSLLTRGSGAITREALFSPLASLSGIFTYLNDLPGNSPAILGQIAHLPGMTAAHCRFLAPEGALNSRSLSDLLDGLLKQIGGRGAHGLIAEVDEGSPAFSALRQNGFSIYARQQIWKVGSSPAVEKRSSWRPVLIGDELSIQILRNALVPGQVQQIEETHGSPDGYVLNKAGQLLAYAEVKRGPRGIWLQPFISLDAEPFDEALVQLLVRLRPRAGRPVFVCLRSYQDWLSIPLRKLGAEPGPSQVVMAKRTTLPLKVEEARRLPVSSRSAEPTTPIHVPPPTAHEPEWITYDQTPNYR